VGSACTSWLCHDAKQGKKYYKDIESFYWMKIVNDKIIGPDAFGVWSSEAGPDYWY
jgi:hypothetical protein